jgi:hypothetical protein
MLYKSYITFYSVIFHFFLQKHIISEIAKAGTTAFSKKGDFHTFRYAEAPNWRSHCRGRIWHMRKKGVRAILQDRIWQKLVVLVMFRTLFFFRVQKRCFFGKIPKAVLVQSDCDSEKYPPKNTFIKVHGVPVRAQKSEKTVFFLRRSYWKTIRRGFWLFSIPV